MEKLVVLDFNTHTVHIFNVENDAEVDINALGYGIDSDNCVCMWGESVDVIRHKGVIKKNETVYP